MGGSSSGGKGSSPRPQPAPIEQGKIETGVEETTGQYSAQSQKRKAAAMASGQQANVLSRQQSDILGQSGKKNILGE